MPVTPLIHVFDLGNVLLFFDFGLFYEKLAPRSRRADVIEQVVWEHYHSSRIARGGDFGTFYRGVADALSLDMPLDDFRLAFNDIFAANEPMIEVVRRLPRPRFLLSNTNAAHTDWWRSHFPEVLPLFDGCVLSHEVGAEKPEEAIYRQVERLSGVSPGRHVFTDDVPEFAAAARSFGWHGIHFTGADDYLRQLAALSAGGEGP
ncbi:MAG: HAD-IA family hydrolase [Armatimonadota bacterium]